MKDIKFIDATLRDGSHAVKHQINTDTIEKYCSMIDDAGLEAVIVGHGNGLGGSTIQIGLSKHSDLEMLSAARKHLKKTKLGIYMIPGIGTIKDDLIPAIDVGVDLFKIGCHCTEADTTKQHISYLSNHNKEVYGTLMMSHMASPERLLKEALLMESYGAKGVILFDSAGALLPDDVKSRIKLLVKNTNLEIGFHGHNNLGLGISNTIEAINAGATIADGTLKGFGAGAGNCQLEALISILYKEVQDSNIDLYKLLDTADLIVENEFNFTKGISSLSLISGLSGVFSAFSEKVKAAAVQFDVDPRDIFIELGKRKIVGGQEDMIVDVAMNLAQKNKEDDTSYIFESLL